MKKIVKPLLIIAAVAAISMACICNFCIVNAEEITIQAKNLEPHSPISIYGNSEFTSKNGVTSGSGTQSDPYIIENWDISASTANGIEISDTDAHPVISNVTVISDTDAHIKNRIEISSTAYFDPSKIIIPLDSEKEVSVILDGAPNGLSGYSTTIPLSPLHFILPLSNVSVDIINPRFNVDVAEITSVDFPSWAAVNSNSPLPSDSVWIKAVDLNKEVESGTMDVTLATLTIRGDKLGSCNILITGTKMDDDSGNPIEVFTIPGQVVVVAVIPFPRCANPPTDPDNDGLYEDINGNKRKDFDDVVCFFENLEWAEKNQPRECFDFNENGRIDFDDVVKLFEEI